MTKRFISLALAMLLILGLVPTAFASDSHVLYVATDGNDSAVGTETAPLKTFEGAVARVRELKAQGIKVTEVIFREGDYRVYNARMTELDSGTEENPIVYRAYDGEKVAFKGSKVVDVTKAKQVTDEATLARLHKNAKGKLIAVDLKAQGFTQDDIFDTSWANGIENFAWDKSLKGDYNVVFVDGRELDIAQWPNGRRYTTWGKTLSDYSFTYSESEPERWVNAKNWWIGSFSYYDFSYTTITPERIDPKEKVIYMPAKSVQVFYNPYSKRWKAFNLLEELDIPGEYYIDRDSMTLYMYPPHTLANSKVEISTADQYIVCCSNTTDVVFKDIEFSQSRNSGVRVTNVRNIDFLGCTFRDCAAYGLQNTGTSDNTPVTYDLFGGKRMKNDASYDMDIKGCVFDNMGVSSIWLLGGNVDTLTPSNNVIEDCYFYSSSNRYLFAAVYIAGVGITVRQNTITHVRQHAITMVGNDHIVEQNEVYDVIRDVGDAAAIYQGRQHLYRGSVVRRNFLYDIAPTDPLLVSGTVGIYMDDTQLGNTVEQNIIHGVSTAYNNNGAGQMTVRNNTIVDALKYSMNFHNTAWSEGDVNHTTYYATVDEEIASIKDKDLYFSRYPELGEWARTHKNIKSWNRITDNLIVGDAPIKIASQDEKYATFEHNVQVPSTDDFVNPADMDFRLKSDSTLAKELPGVLTDSFDIEEIGAQSDFHFNGDDSPFRILWPKKNSTVSSDKVELHWQEPFGANRYRVEVARDINFTDVIHDEIHPYNYALLGDLDAGETYYWRVTAMNTSRRHKASWQNVGGIHRFSTNMYNALNTDAFSSTVSVADRITESSVEGTTPGTYKIGTAGFIRNYIDVTKSLIKFPIGQYTQSALDARTQFIADYYNDKSLINKGYVDFANYLDAKYWNDKAVSESGTITNSNIGSVVGTKGLGQMSGAVMYCFDVTLNGTDASWIPLGLNKDVVTQQYKGSNNGYYMVVKKGLIELQKTDGSASTIVATKEDINLIDGKKHTVRYGVINTSLGCTVLAIIDGETVFAYSDVTTTAQTGQQMEFAFTAPTDGDNVVISKTTAAIPDQAHFDRLLTNLEYNSARAVLTYIETSMPGTTISGVKILKPGETKIVTEEGIFDSSYAAPELSNEYVMLPANVAAEIFGGKASISGTSASFTVRGKSFTFTNGTSSYTADGVNKASKYTPYMKNGHLMIALTDVLDVLGIQHMIDLFNGGAVVITDEGSINSANQASHLQAAAAILSTLSGIDTGDAVYFSDIKFN